MKLLAWDTSSRSGVVVALEWPANSPLGFQSARLVAELTLNVDLTHSERLLWGIHQVLESARWKLEDVDFFGVGVGPGSFTGLRIGMTTARTLAHAMKKPLVGVSSLAALARPVATSLIHFTKSSKTWVIATTDACKGEVFALWGQSKQVIGCVIEPDLWVDGVREEVMGPEVLIEDLLKKMGTAHWVAVGEGRNRYSATWERLPSSQELKDFIPNCNQIQGRYLGLLVWEAIQANLGREALWIHPRYLRASDAELKLRARAQNAAL